MLGDDRQREPWQLDQWSHAIQWYLEWLKACHVAKSDHRSLPERLRIASNSAGARRGLARRTKQCYGAWLARYGKFANSDRDAMQETTATRFLTSVVDDEDCAYSTQKQALNALAFFFKHVCGIENPVFRVKLRKTSTKAAWTNSRTIHIFTFGLVNSARGAVDAKNAAHFSPDFVPAHFV